jgi:uncharacterized RDD family membrane protein YckC
MAEEMENTDPPDQSATPIEQSENVSEPIPESDPPLSDEEPERIGFGKRLGAYLLDSIFTIIAAGVVGYALKDLFAGLIPVDPNVPDELRHWVAAITGAAGICTVLYGLIEGFTGASPGKMILAIKIGTENSLSANTNTLLKRYALKTSASILALISMILGVEILNTVGNLVGIVIFIGCFFALGATKQALHDKIAHTAVYPEDTIP